MCAPSGSATRSLVALWLSLFACRCCCCCCLCLCVHVLVCACLPVCLAVLLPVCCWSLVAVRLFSVCLCWLPSSLLSCLVLSPPLSSFWFSLLSLCVCPLSYPSSPSLALSSLLSGSLSLCVLSVYPCILLSPIRSSLFPLPLVPSLYVYAYACFSLCVCTCYSPSPPMCYSLSLYVYLCVRVLLTVCSSIRVYVLSCVCVGLCTVYAFLSVYVCMRVFLFSYAPVGLGVLFISSCYCLSGCFWFDMRLDGLTCEKAFACLGFSCSDRQR